MKKDKKIKGLRAAVQAFNAWQGKAVIYYFPEFGDIDTYVYADSNDFDVFRSTEAVEIISKDDLYGRDNKIKEKEVKRILAGL